MKEHNHSHPTVSVKDINRSFIIGIGLNLVYALFEGVFGFQSGSAALVSDALHNLGDVSGLLIALLAFRLQRVSSGKIFTYGLRKASILASFINSLFLAVAIGGILWEGIHRIFRPEKVDGGAVMLAAGIGIIINMGSALLFRHKKEKDLNLKAAYWHLMADALVSLGAVLSGFLMFLTGWDFLDGIAAVLISVFILFSTWDLFKDSLIAVMDGVPSVIRIDEIKKHIQNIDGVHKVHHIHVWNLSTNQIALTCHVALRNIQDLQSVKAEIKKELSEHGIDHSTIEFEPVSE
ncbi:MAG TPA: cation diffusion facilitator family transporter [Leptospiraceae bacterium]|nr:cation diffusion facilitator family transporter [Leptospiraceae bacterium]HMY65813.1 cation diffusion facilitator family transporter [Leptospiraceae bacterium]HNF13342.1 cation diffusion facilitator family transporter [Leptospiraceae bacterium]HNF22834.1 cation diffusion facilitator family transporter [Leptospiraceae bacterium]HNI95334.1 cation diffusion facilitator family transporter [Leptospiraceae bacterium]